MRMRLVLPMPSLQHLAQLKILTCVYSNSQADIFTQVTSALRGSKRRRCHYDDVAEVLARGEEWQAIEEQVRNKISALPLPEPLRAELRRFVRPLGVEIIDWFQCHKLNPGTDRPPSLRWTMRGTVDYVRTAEQLARDERWSVERRYELACTNGLDTEARELIPLISNQKRREYLHEKRWSWDRESHQRFLFFFFTRALLGPGEMNQQDPTASSDWVQRRERSILRFLFERMIRVGNRTMCEFLFSQFSQEEKKNFSRYCASVLEGNCFPPAFVVYYLRLMQRSAEPRRNLTARACNYVVLKRLLGWPAQPLFLECARRGWRSMNKKQRLGLFKAILEKIIHARRDYDYASLFRECWAMNSSKDQLHFLNRYSFLCGLIRSKEEECVRLALDQAPLDRLKKLFWESQARETLMDENVVSESALKECEEKAKVDSSHHPNDMNKLMRSQYLTRLVGRVLERRRMGETYYKAISMFKFMKMDVLYYTLFMYYLDTLVLETYSLL